MLSAMLFLYLSREQYDNTSKLDQNGWHFAGDIFIWILSKEDFFVIQILWKFRPIH